MRREFFITEDGSTSIHLPKWNENYHSKHGAISEAYHVFLKMGLFPFAEKHPPQTPINILEIGFGTGLNAFITFLEAQKIDLPINYTGAEAYPVEVAEVKKLNYVQQLSAGKYSPVFNEMHTIPWEKFQELAPGFYLKKENKFFGEINEKEQFHLVYFDAFGPRVQPELWTETMFKKMHAALKNNGRLVTYSSKGSVKRALKRLGFEVEILPGPPGKRHMLRASKV